MLQQNLELQGRYKFDVYDKSGNLKQSQIVKNFITPSGLDFPVYIPFADCFRYISLGSGTTPNSNAPNVTTGLAQFVKEFSYIGGNIEDYYGGHNHYELQACGYRENSNGVTLARAWRIPSGGGFFEDNYIFKEAMVSPGRPAPAGLTCNDIELSDLVSVYPRNSSASICSPTFTKAFSRIIKDVSVEKDNFLVVTYELDILLNTGVNYFEIPVTRTTDIGDPNNWKGVISGVYNIIHHGVNLIRGSDLPYRPRSVDQHLPTFEHLGDSFVGPLGSPLEPSCPVSNYRFYLSTDNSQFIVNETSGGNIITGSYNPYNPDGKLLPSGNMYYHSRPMEETNIGNNLWFGGNYWFLDVRKTTEPVYPCEYNIETKCSPNNLYTISADLISANFEPRNVTDRFRRRRITAEIRGTSAGVIQGQPIRSLVFGHIASNHVTIYPFIDLVFADKDNGILPQINTGIYDLNYSVYNNYNFLDVNNNLTFDFHIVWSAPCGDVPC